MISFTRNIIDYGREW